MLKLIDHFGINTTNERNETIKAVTEIDNSTLLKMGFHKVEECLVFLKSKTHREEHGGSNVNNEEGDDTVPMEDDTVQAAEQSCYEVHHTSSHRMESPTEHARSQRMRSPSTEYRGDSPAPQSMNEDVAVIHHNALVAYQAPEYRGEPMSMFERQVLYRLDALSEEQKTYFEATQARFQHLDHQIEGVQVQLAELYYKE